MKTKFDSFKAWLKSLPLALGLPAGIWILIWGTTQWRGLEQTSRSEINGVAIVLGVTIFVHLLAYVVTGLPIFLCRYKEAHSPIWMPEIGVPLGAATGALVVFLTLGIFYRTGTTLLQPIPYLIGAGYGTATAIAALLQRPTREKNENSHHLL